MRETFEIMRFIEKHRFQKKKKLYRLALGVAFDWTVSIYAGVLAVLVLVGFFYQLNDMREVIIHYQQLIDPYLSLVLMGLIIKMIVMSFRQPGVIFSSAEWKIASLTYSATNIWLYRFVKQMLTYFAIISSIFLFLIFVTPLTLAFLGKWYLFILLFQFFTLLPQWYYYQIRGWKKLIIFIGFFATISLLRMAVMVGFETQWFPYILLGCLILLNGWLWPRKLHHVNWGRVVEQSDLKIWNMFFINKMSDMQIKPAQKQYFLQSLFTSKKARLPYSYGKPDVIIRKIWKKYMAHDINIIAMMLVTVAICMVILSERGPMPQGIGILLSVFMWEKVTLSFSRVIFSDKLVHSIPWDLEAIKKAFIYWVTWISSVVVIIIFFTSLGMNILHLVFVIFFIIFVLYFLLHIQLNNKMKKLNNKWHQMPVLEQIIVLLVYVTLAFSIAYPLVMSVCIVMLIFMLCKKTARRGG